jgi:hypothetical protein
LYFWFGGVWTTVAGTYLQTENNPQQLKPQSYSKPYNKVQLTGHISVPRAINHVTKLFKGTYGLPRCPEGFFLKGLSNFELRDTFGSSLGPLVLEI